MTRVPEDYLAYCPTRQQIAAATKKIRAGWSKHQHIVRNNYHPKPIETPFCDLSEHRPNFVEKSE